jgi:hypothetical protein
MMTIVSLIKEFEHRYQEQALLRYATLQPGYAFAAADELCARLQVDSLPEEYIALYRWKKLAHNCRADGPQPLTSAPRRLGKREGIYHARRSAGKLHPARRSARLAAGDGRCAI